MDTHELLNRYEDLCRAADLHAEGGWRSEREDSLKRTVELTPQVLDRFADYEIGGIGFELGNDFFGDRVTTGGIPALRKVASEAQWSAYEQKCWFGAKALLRDAASRGLADFEACVTTLSTDDVVGGVHVGLRVDREREIKISMHTVRVADRAVQLGRQLERIPATVLEIGGGNGRFVRDVGKLAPGSRIYYVDLVLTLAIAARYLTRVFPGEVHLAWDDKQPIPSDVRIVLVPPWRIAEIPVPPDVCCNFLSFQHMERRNLEYYGSALLKIGCRTIFHRNRIGALRPGEVRLDPDCFCSGWVSRSRTAFSAAEVSNRDIAAGPIGRLPIVEEFLVHQS